MLKPDLNRNCHTVSTLDYRAKRAYQRGIKWLMGSALFAAIGVGGVLAYDLIRNRPPAPVSVELTPVELGAVEKKISEGGTLELGGQRSIKSPEDGAVERILVDVGDRVSEGQELIGLRNPDRETILQKKQIEIRKQEITVDRDRQKVTEAEEELAAAEAWYQRELAKYEREVESKEAVQNFTIEKLEAAVNRNRQKVREAEEELAAAEAKLETDRQLLERGFVAQDTIDQQEQTVRTKRANFRDEKHNLEVARVELETEKAELISISTVLDSKPIVEAEVKLRQAQSELRTSQSDLDRLKVEYQEEALKLQNYVITAPIDGIVLNINVKPGDGVNRSDDLIALGDPNQEVVQLKLSTLNAVQVKPGQLARVTEIGPDPEIFTGRVERIDLRASSSENNQSSDSGQAAVPATIKLDRPTGSLIPGSPVSVEIVLDSREAVIVLNTELIQRDEESPYVWVLDADDRAQKRPVTLGLEGLLQVEVKSGLSPGDRVISPSPDAPLKPGMSVSGEAAEPPSTPSES
ncbi:MAG: efflux RND transporter periplasmic adaptor subunit [Limnospira sp.]